MKLSANWFTEGYIDFEQKKYTLLAYLQSVRKQFSSARLFPDFGELIQHYTNMVQYRENRDRMQSGFHRNVSGIDADQMRIVYEHIPDAGAIEEVNEIVEYSFPLLREGVEEGRSLYDFVESKIGIAPVGVLPLHRDAGYFFLCTQGDLEVSVYEYHCTLIEQPDERYRAIRTTCVESFTRSITRTYESVKLELIRRKPDLPNPAAWSVEAGLAFPRQEAFLPVARRKLMRLLAHPC